MNLKLAKQFLALHHERKAVEKRLAELKTEMARLDPMLLEDMAQEGISRMSIDGWNLGTKRSLIVTPTNTDKAAQCRALIAAGYKDLVTVGYNINSLSAEYRELERNDELGNIAEIMKQNFKTFEKFAVNVTKEAVKK